MPNRLISFLRQNRSEGLKSPQQISIADLENRLSKRKAAEQMLRISQRASWEYRKSIKDWILAQDDARSLTRPRFRRLMELYRDLVKDPHMSAVMQSRILKVLNAPMLLCDANGEVNEQATALIDKAWAYELNELAMESVFYGTSLIGFDVTPDGVNDIFLVPRENVIPPLQSVLHDVYADDMTSYMDPPESNFYVPMGLPDDLGLLNKAAPYLLFKKDGLASWNRWQQIFGIPPVVAKSHSTDQAVIDKIMKMLGNLMNSARAVIPGDTELEVLNMGSTTNVKETYDLAMERVNSEISKLVLGNTMTTDDGSSRSQSEVHERREEEITKADMRRLELWWNDEILPRLIRFGYPLQGLYFKFDRTGKLDVKQQWTIVDGLLKQGYTIDEEYLAETFNVPIIGRDPLLIPGNTHANGNAGDPNNPDDPIDDDPDPDDDPDDPTNRIGFHLTSKKKDLDLTPQLTQLYAHDHGPVNVSFRFVFEGLEKLIQKLFNRELNAGDVDPDLHAQQYATLRESIEQGMQAQIGAIDYSTPKGALIEQFRRNVFVFSAFKNYHQLREMSNALLDAEGQVRPFADFRKQALAVHEKYNLNWLRSEYNHAIASAQMADRWIEMDEDVMLRYDTANDERVRTSHQALNRVTLPKSDPFWNTFYPPNGWGCRCDVAEVVNARPTTKSRIQYPEVDDMFRGNPGKDGVLFPKKHPYYKVQQQHRNIAKRNFGLTDPDQPNDES